MELLHGNDREILVSREYVRFVVAETNEKMAANRRRTEGFYQALLRSGGFGSASVEAECGNGSVCGGDDGGEQAEAEREGKEDGALSGNLVLIYVKDWYFLFVVLHCIVVCFTSSVKGALFELDCANFCVVKLSFMVRLEN